MSATDGLMRGMEVVDKRNSLILLVGRTTLEQDPIVSHHVIISDLYISLFSFISHILPLLTSQLISFTWIYIGCKPQT